MCPGICRTPVSLLQSGAEPVFGAGALGGQGERHRWVWRAVGMSVQAETAGLFIVSIVLQKVDRMGAHLES